MKLERMHLRNFRCFEEITVNFDKRLTVIVAENGAGKTAILDAIAIGLGRFLTKLPNLSGSGATDTDLRITNNEQCAPYMAMSWEAITRDGQPIVWGGLRRRDGRVNTLKLKKRLSDEGAFHFLSGLKEIQTLALSLLDAEEEKKPYFVPVFAYYGTNRTIREEVQRRRNFRKNFSRLHALEGALDPDSRFRSAFEWFNAAEDEERRERDARRDFDYCHPELEAVRTAIVRLLGDDFSNPRTEIRPLRFVIDRKMPDDSTRTLRVSQLSDGFRVMLGLTMDLARRMAQANGGHEGSFNPLDEPAIALIDEVDLHLHPSWQQRVLSDLQKTFRRTQFIVTTHSPQVLSTVKRKNIRTLQQDDLGNTLIYQPGHEVIGIDSGAALDNIMRVNPIPSVKEARWVADYTAKIENGTHEDSEGQRLRKWLLTRYGKQHPVILDVDRLIRFQTFKLRNKSSSQD